MIGGLIEGLVGGLISPFISKWLGRFKYWIAFLIGFFATPAYIIINLMYDHGMSYVFHNIPVMWENFKKDHWGLVLLNVVIGLLCVFIAFNATLPGNKKYIKNGKADL